MKRLVLFSMVAAVAAAVAFISFHFLRGSAGRARRVAAPDEVRFLSMGTLAAATFCSGDAARGAEIVSKAFDEIEAAASVFRDDSKLSRLNRDGSLSLTPVAPGAFDLAALLRQAFAVSEDTDGAFDPTVNPLMRLWGFRGGEVRETPPDDAEIAAALERVGWRHVALVNTFAGGLSVFLGRSGMELDLGGIAKGAAVDLAFERLRAAGYRDFMVNLGGNIRVSGQPEPGRDEWRVAVRDPANPDRTIGEPITLHDGEAVATSGSYERFVEIGGVRYSHIIDPRTGRPAARSGSVSVVAPTAAEADAYSTAYFVLGRGAADGGATVIRR